MDNSTLDWLKLEVSLDIIGNMIAYNVSLLDRALREDPQNYSLHKTLEQSIDFLAQERQRCYSENNQDVIAKAYSIYGPFLKNRFDRI